MRAKLPMELQIILLRIWRRIRHRYLSIAELSMQDDLTIAEVLMIVKAHQYAETHK